MKHVPRLILFTAVVVCIASGIAFPALLISHHQREVRMIREAKQRTLTEAERGAVHLDDTLKELATGARVLADDLSSGRLTDAGVVQRLHDDAQKLPSALGINVAYAPFQYDPRLRLHAPLLVRHGETTHLTYVETRMDYTQTDWYRRGEKEAGWPEPAFSTLGNTVLANYVTPFYTPGANGARGAFRGVVRVLVSQKTLQRYVSALDLGQNGYAYVISRTGVLLAHPFPEWVRAERTLASVAKGTHDDALLALAGQQGRGDVAGPVAHVDLVTQQHAWELLLPVRTPGWALGAVFIVRDATVSPQQARREAIVSALCLVAFLFSLSLVVFRPEGGDTKRLWAVAIAASVLMGGTTAYIWYLVITQPDQRQDAAQRLTNLRSVETFEEAEMRRSRASRFEEPTFVPTGLLVQSINLQSATDVLVTGYVWQKYADDVPASVTRAVSFPEMESGSITEAYRRRGRGETVIGWSFSITLRQSHTGQNRYPLDDVDVRVRLWPHDFDKNVILVPDLEAYTTLIPSSLPGLTANPKVAGWSLRASYFGFQEFAGKANFGIDQFAGERQAPELFFATVMRRNFLNAFVSSLLPLMVVTFLVFVLLMLVNKNEQKKGLGFNALSLVSSSAALLFAVILGQSTLREKLAASGLVYLEYFYLVMYFAITVICIGAIMFVEEVELSYVQYRDHLIPKLLYWPVLTAYALVVTILTYY